MIKNRMYTNGMLCGSFFRLLALILSLLPTVCFATDYMVSTQAEFDAIKNAVLLPGDAILLERGQSFVGELAPTGTGTAADPIRIDAFGTGDRPLIDAQGLNEAGVRLEGNIVYWEVSGLEIINDNGNEDEADEFFGILVVVSGLDDTVYEHIYIDDNYIHDVNTGLEGKDRGGIHVYMEGLNRSVINDLRITNNRIEDIGGVGIANRSSCGDVTVHEAGGYTAEYLWTGVYIGGNYISRTGRNSIIIRVSQDPMVERNVAAYPGRHSQGNSIFCFDTVGCIMQYNEAYGNTVAGSTHNSYSDRGGFDADYTCVDTYIQYNYSHDNEYFCAIMKKIHRNVTIRYNVTQDEKRGFYFYGFNSNSEVENVHIYNNTHYVSAGNSAAVFVEGRKPHDTLLENNIFYFEDANDASYGTGDLSGATFNNNLYYNIAPHASDLNPISGDPLLTMPGIAGTDIDLTTMGAMSGYQLLSGSPAFDESSAISGTVDVDIMGNLIYDGVPDVGALEFQGATSQVTFDFVEGSVWDGGSIGTNATVTNGVTGESITLRTIDVIGQDGSKASDGVSLHRTSISGATYMGVDDQAGGIGGYGSEYRNFNPNEGWIFAFDEDVYLENIQLGSQNSDAELTLSSDLFDDMVLADGQPNDIHDLEYRYIPAGTELSLMMTTATNGVDTGIGVANITVSAIPFLSRPNTVVQAELYDDAIGVVVQPGSDDGGGQMVEFDAAGDEISYEVNVPNTGTYLVGFRVASDSGLLNMELVQGATTLTTLNRVIDAGGIWSTVYKVITLEAGDTTLAVIATDGATQWLNWFDLTVMESATPAALPFADGFDEGFAPIWDSTAFLSGGFYEGVKAAKMNESDYVKTDIDTTGYYGIRVSYARKTDGLAAGSSFVSEWYDGASWNTIESISSGFTAWEVVSQIVLPAGADNNPNFRLRFRVNAGGDFGYVDSVVVDGVNLPMTMAMNADSISLEWFNMPGASYAVQCSTNLLTDPFSTTIESGIPALTATNSLMVEIPEDPAAFYRVIAE